MSSRRQRICMAMLAGAAVPVAAVRGSAVIVVPTQVPATGMGIGQSQWTQASAELSTAAGGQIVTSASALDNPASLDTFNGLWIDLGSTTESLTSAEAANLSAYIQTGRRVVLMGENSAWATWDESILGAVGGSYAGGNYSGASPTRSYVSLTTGVASCTVSSGGVAAAGTTLFENRVATLWGPAQNAVVLLDTDALADSSQGIAGNGTFSSNLTSWVAGGLGATVSWKNSLGGTWTTASGWSTGLMPSVADTVSFNLGQNGAGAGGYTVTVPSSKIVSGVTVAADKVTLALPSGSAALQVSQAIAVSPPANQIGALAFTLSSGSAAAAAQVTAGSLAVGGASGSTASLTVNAGVAVTVTGGATVASGATLNQSGGTLAVGGAISGSGSMVQTGGSTSAQTIRLSSLSISGATVTVLPQAGGDEDKSVCVLNSLSLGQSGRLDLEDNDLIVEDGDLATLTAELASGYDGGKWDGPGIDSTAASDDPAATLTIFQNSDGLGNRLYGSGAPLGLFDGQDPAYDAILVKYSSAAVPDPTGSASVTWLGAVVLPRQRRKRAGVSR